MCGIKSRIGSLVLLVGSALSGALPWSSAAAQTIEQPGLWERTKQNIVDIAEDGAWDIYASGYAYHSRETYGDKRVRKLNEKAWGGGFGKTLRNEKGNDESLYLMAIRDSHKNLQAMAGYAHQWIYPLGSSGLEAGAGVTALLMHREDWFGGVPFPAVLPLASFGTRDIKLMATYVPRLSTKRGKGDVLLMFLKFEF